MAKAPKTKLYDFSNRAPDWARNLQEKYNSRKTAEAEINAVLAENLGPDEEVSEEEYENAVQLAMAGQPYNIKSRPKTVEEPVIPQAAIKPQPSTLRSLDARANLAISSGLADIAADLQFRDIDAAAAETIRKQEEERTIAEGNKSLLNRSGGSLIPDFLERDYVAPYVAKISESIGGLEGYQKIFGKLTDYTKQARKSLEESTAARIEEAPVLGRIERTATDVLGSPQSLASIPGGAFAAIPGTITYNNAYREAREAGLTPEQAGEYAANQAAAESAISALPTGKFISVLRKPAGELAEVVSGRIARTIATGTGEAGEEAVQQLAQEAINRAYTTSDDEATRAFAEGQVSADVLGDVLRAGAAGFAGGAAVQSVTAGAQKAAELGRQVAETTEKAAKVSAGELRKARLERIKQDTEVIQELALEEQRIRAAEESERAFQERERQLAEDEQRRADEEEAGFRTMENLREFGQPERVERYAGVTERTPIQPPASAEVSPEQIAEERATAAEQEAARKERVELGGLTEEVRKQRVKEEKAAAKAKKAEEKASALVQRQRRAQIISDLRKENPSLSDTELAPLVRERLKQPAAEDTTELTNKVETVQNRIKGQEKAKVTRAENQAIKNVVKQNPDATPKQIVDIIKGNEKAAPATTPDNRTSDAEIAELTQRLNLGMKAQQKDSGGEDYDEPGFLKKSAAIIKAVGSKNKRNTADVQNLLRQGKMILAPNPQSLNRQDDGNAAEYDTETGKMYLYTDRVKANDVVGVLERTLHESTHAGQFNDRQGRPSIYKQMMSKSGENKASKTIREAATKGNKIAQKAVELAQKASPDTPIQELELVPYFVGEAVKARGKQQSLGRLGSVANDITASAKNFLRDKMGVELDVTLNDLVSASQDIGREVVKTTIRGEKGGKTLGMVLGPTAKGFKKAKAEGKTYKEVADKGERFEISDADAALVNDATLELLIPFGPDEVNTVKADEFLNHDNLYNEYPWLANYNIDIKDLGPLTYGEHATQDKTIAINSSLLRSALYGNTTEAKQSAKDRIRNTVLHEMQHAIQVREGFVAGANPAEFLPQSVINDKERAAKKLADIVKNFELGRAVQTLSPQARKAWDNEVKASGVESREAQSALFLDEGYYADVSDRLIKRYGETSYQNAVREFTEANLALRVAEDKAFRTYLRDQGEFEARGTERRSRLTQEEIEATPRSKEEPEEVVISGRKETVSREQVIDTRPLARTGKPAESKVLGRKAEAEEEAPAKRKIKLPPIVSSLIDSYQGVGRNLNEVIEYASTSPAGATMQAEAFLGKYDRAVTKLAAEQGMSPLELSKQIAEDLDKVDATSDSYEDNRAAFAEVASKYGTAGEALMQLRDQIDQLTLDIIKQRAQDPTPLTDKERKLYKTLLSNLGRYSHRQYATNAGKAGKKYATKVWKDYEKVKANEGGEFKKATLDNYHKAAAAVRYLVDDRLRIPDSEELANLGDEQVQSLYDTWGKFAGRDALTVDEMRAELDERRPLINQNDNLEAEAEETAKALLGIIASNKPVPAYFRGGKEDTGFLQERAYIPKVLRDLMGEITDPGLRLLTTAAKQAEFVSRNKMLLELRDFDGGEHVASPDTPASQRKGMHKLEGEAWGPMDGWYVSTEMRNRIGDVIQTLATFEQAAAMAATSPGALNKLATSKALDTWTKITGVSKMAQIIYNPINFVYNFIGAPRMLVTNGNYNPVNIGKALKASYELIEYAANPKAASEEAIRLNKFGITDSAFIGEIKSAKYQQLSDEIKRMSNGEPNAFLANMAGFGRKAGLTAKETYAMMDVWSKVANFYHQVDVLTDFYAKEGVERTAEQIDREAADVVSRTNITYKRAAPLVKAMERGGLTQFGTYFSEVFRSEIANVLQGIDEINRGRQATTPEGSRAMIAQGTKRLTGQAAVWGLTAYVANALAGVFGDDEDERKAKRSLLPEYMRNQDFFPVGKDSKGDTVLFNVSRFDAAGPITDIMRSIMHEDASAKQVGKNLLDLYVAPRIAGQMYKALQVMAGAGPQRLREPTVQQVAPEAFGRAMRVNNILGIEDRTTKAWTNVAETFLPGIVNAYRDTNAVPVPEDAQSALANVITYTGATMYKMDPKESAKYLDYSRELKNARRDLADIASDYPDGIPENELLSRVIDARGKELAAFAEMQKVWDGMRATGMSKREAAAVMKAQKIDTDAIRQLARGQFESQVISKSSLREYMNKELKEAPRSEHAEIKRKWKELYNQLNLAEQQAEVQ